MKISQLKCFVVAAQEKNLSSVARILKITQPAVSMQIRSLEKYCGMKLIVGHSRGIHLTHAGKRLASRAEEIIHLVDKCDLEIDYLRNSEVNTVRIGITPAIGQVLVPQLIEHCHDEFPNVTLLFNQGFTDELWEAWENCEVELVFTSNNERTSNVNTIDLYWEQFHLFGDKDIINDLPNPVPVSRIADLPLVLDGREDFIRNVIDQELSRVGKRLMDTIEIPTISIRRQYAVKKQRFCIAPYALFLTEVQLGQCGSVPIQHSAMRRLIQLAGPNRSDQTKLQTAIWDLVVDLVQTNVKKGNFGWSDPTNTPLQKPDPPIQ